MKPVLVPIQTKAKAGRPPIWKTEAERTAARLRSKKRWRASLTPEDRTRIYLRQKHRLESLPADVREATMVHLRALRAASARRRRARERAARNKVA